jgi:hypothetical protein
MIRQTLDDDLGDNHHASSVNALQVSSDILRFLVRFEVPPRPPLLHKAGTRNIMSVSLHNTTVSPIFSSRALSRGPTLFNPPLVHNRVPRGCSKCNLTKAYRYVLSYLFSEVYVKSMQGDKAIVTVVQAWGRGSRGPRSPPDDLDLKGKEVFFNLGSGGISKLTLLAQL